MVLLVSYLEYTYQNDCLSKMNVRKKKEWWRWLFVEICTGSVLLVIQQATKCA